MAKEFKDMVFALDIGTAKVMVVAAEVLPGGELRVAGLGIAGAPEDPAYALLYLASDEARFVTGHTLLVDAGQTTGGTIPAFHNGAVGLIGAPAAD